MSRVETRTIGTAMLELAQTIQCDDGVANAVCAQAAERLAEQEVRITQLEKMLSEDAALDDVLCKAHDLSLDGYHRESRDLLRETVARMRGEK